VTPADEAKARHRLWALLGQVLADGPTETVLALPALAGHWIADDDERAAEHQRVTGFEVRPWETVFRDPDAREAVRTAYAAGGFHPGRRDLELDHAGVQLAYLSHLAAAEHDALVDGVDATAIGRLERAFLAEHVLRWFPWLVVALRRARAPLYATTAELALELAQSRATRAPEPAPVADDPLDDPSTGLGRIARHLCTPSLSGLWLGQSTIAAAAAAAGVPSGFDSRARRLESVLFAAVDHGRLPELVAALDAEAEDQAAQLVALGAGAESIAVSRTLLRRLAWTP
jgi:hypothetical protein